MLDEESGFEPRKRVCRSAEERAAIVAETYVAGATVAGVAKKKAGKSKPQGYAEIAVLPDAPFDGIEIIIGSVSVRLPKTTAAKRIGDIARALRG